MSISVKRDSGLYIGDVDVAPASGTIQITENGEHNVTQYAVADVNVPQPSGKISITENGTDIDVAQYALADVNVPQPSGSHYIDTNGTYDIAQYSSVTVDVRNQLNDRAGVGTGGYTIVNKFYPINNKIKSYAFYSDSHLTDVDISYLDLIYDIYDYAFANCTGLHSFVLPTHNNYDERCVLHDHVFDGAGTPVFSNIDLSIATSIGDYCFNNTNINTIIFSRLTTLSTNTFSGASYLSDIYYTGSQSDWENITNYNNCGLDQSVTIHYNYVPEGE